MAAGKSDEEEDNDTVEWGTLATQVLWLSTVAVDRSQKLMVLVAERTQTVAELEGTQEPWASVRKLEEKFVDQEIRCLAKELLQEVPPVSSVQ